MSIQPGQRTPNLQGSPEPLSRTFDVALLDLDGVVYVGPDAVAGVPAALAAVREHGMRLAFVTNNAARPPTVVAEHLTRLGIPAVPDEVTTSAQAAAGYLANRLAPGAHVLVVGTVGLEQALAERGLVPVAVADGDTAAVVQGYSPDLNWRQLAEGAVAIGTGVPWVATNADPTVPSSRGPLPGNGSMVAALTHATRAVPIITGKPDPTMHLESVLRSGAHRPIVVGDRLDTDIEGANAANCPSLLVLSGVTDASTMLSAGPQSRPMYVGRDAGALLQIHPDPSVTDSQVVVNRWRVTHDGQALTLARCHCTDVRPVADDSGDGLDAIRALAVASWRVQDAGSGRPEILAADSEAEAVLTEHGLR
ncbi:MAG: HAD-IIA family hydrolase [Jatrophihabitantaceae bacterium]